MKHRTQHRLQRDRRWPALKNLDEQARFRLGIYHEYDDGANEQKLRRLYGKVARRQDDLILKLIHGQRVLDVGAGYGLLASRLRAAGHTLVAIDLNPRARQLAKQWFNVEVLAADIHAAPFPNASFDTAILREVVEHLDFETAVKELRRVVTRELIIFQTNLNGIVRTARWALGHHELNAQPLRYYAEVLRREGFLVQSVRYLDPLALPLSGGLLTRQWCPPFDWAEEGILTLDGAVGNLAERLHFSRFLCWRYLLHAVREPRRGDETGDTLTEFPES